MAPTKNELSGAVRTMKYSIRGGVDIPIDGAPVQTIEDGLDVMSVALSGADFRGVRPEMLVESGSAVSAGQALFRDRNRPEIQFTSPISGTVSAINRGSRRGLDNIVISQSGDSAVSSDLGKKPRELLQETGLWTALRTRPFGSIPDPDAEVESILVTAIDTNPLAADPTIVIASARTDFSKGLEVLVSLSGANVTVCQAQGPELSSENSDGIRFATFNGKHPAGLAGTHLDKLGLAGQAIWQIGYQDVIAIGHLFREGKVSADRIVSLGGPMVKNPRLIRTVSGANLEELLSNELKEGAKRVLSGSILTGRPTPYLGARDTQVTVIPTPPTRRSIFKSVSAGPSAIIPSEKLEGVLPKSFLPVPLMRALSVGDWEEAGKLGCLGLLEEDVALLSYLCSSGNDYAVMLREALDDFAEGAA